MAGCDALNVVMLVQVQPPQFDEEAIRLDEEPALKAGGGEQPLVGSSPTASAVARTTPEAIRIGEEPAWKAGGGKHAACGFEPHGFRLNGYGVMVQQDDASSARWKSGCDSP